MATHWDPAGTPTRPRSKAATSPGVLLAALSSPTRRAWSAIRGNPHSPERHDRAPREMTLRSRQGV